MLVVYEKDVLDSCQTGRYGWGNLYGHLYDREVYRVEAAGSPQGHRPPGMLRLGVWATPAAVGQALWRGRGILAVLAAGEPAFWSLAGGQASQRLSSVILDTKAELFRRLVGIVDTESLSDCCVTILGCGSLGSGVAVLLDTGGIGRFRLVDPQRLETHNVIRHVCGLRDVGRFKVHALAERLLDKNPNLRIEAWAADVCKEPEILSQAVAGSDLVIGATDSPQAQLLINQAALAAGVPAIYPAAYDFGFGGEAIRVMPGQTACLRCVFDATASLFDRREPGSDGQTKAYDADRGHPAMWIDVGIIAHLAARMGMETILSQHDPDQNLTGNYLLWGNRRLWVFQHPLDWQWLSIPRNPGCLVCGGEAALVERAKALGTNVATAAALAEGPLAEEDSEVAALLSGEEEPLA